MQLDYPFTQLPIAFDAARLAEEALAIEEAAWMPHPQGFAGNSMLPLIAINGDPANEEFEGPMRPTPHLARLPYLRQAMAEIGAVAGRTRLMRLDGDAEVKRHADLGYYWFERVRVHVPITTQPSVRFECGDADVNMAPGEVWIFDTWRRHRVTNPKGDRRIHLVMDSVGGPAFWDLVKAGRPIGAGAAPREDWSARVIAFDAEAQPQIPMENRNVPAVMTPWELGSYLAFAAEEMGEHPLAPQAQAIFDRFLKDWRALWAHYGEALEGRETYMRRYAMFLQQLQPIATRIPLANEAPLFHMIRSALTLAIVAPPGGRAVQRTAFSKQNPQPMGQGAPAG